MKDKTERKDELKREGEREEIYILLLNNLCQSHICVYLLCEVFEFYLMFIKNQNNNLFIIVCQ